MLTSIMYYILFIALLIFSFKIAKSNKPTRSLLQGFEIKENEIKDLKKYNKMNSILYIIFAIPFAVAAILTTLGHDTGATIPIVLSSTIGGVLIIIAQFLIYKSCKK